MDTVIGCEGSNKVLLTFRFEHCSFMMSYLLDSKEARNVKNKFDYLERTVGTIVFASSFSVILTDRGGEFRDPFALDRGQDNLVRTSVYYCTPMCSWQKPHCKKNQEYIRKVYPKGTSFDSYSQSDINKLMIHINSTPRKSLGGLSPMMLAKLTLPHELLDYFGLYEMPAGRITLTPALLKNQIHCAPLFRRIHRNTMLAPVLSFLYTSYKISVHILAWFPNHSDQNFPNK